MIKWNKLNFSTVLQTLYTISTNIVNIKDKIMIFIHYFNHYILGIT